MCFNIETHYQKQVEGARRRGNKEDEAYYQEKLDEWNRKNNPLHPDYFVANGFAHPNSFIIAKDEELIISKWGLVPHWAKDIDSAKSIANKTLNARSETIFEKPSFRDAAKKTRCLIPVTSFYEFHHFGGKTYPYRIKPKFDDQFYLAGLHNEWVNKETGELIDTFSIVTTQANELMKIIHNNPKAKGARMPVILTEDNIDQWLYQDVKSDTDKEELLEVCVPYSEENMTFHNVKPLRGKEAVGNSPDAIEEVEYPELAFTNLELKAIIGE